MGAKTTLQCNIVDCHTALALLHIYSGFYTKSSIIVTVQKLIDFVFELTKLIDYITKLNNTLLAAHLRFLIEILFDPLTKFFSGITD